MAGNMTTARNLFQRGQATSRGNFHLLCFSLWLHVYRMTVPVGNSIIIYRGRNALLVSVFICEYFEVTIVNTCNF